MEKHLFNKVRTSILEEIFKIDVQSTDEYDDVIEKYHKYYTAKKEIEKNFGMYYLTFTIALSDYNYKKSSFDIEDIDLWLEDVVMEDEVIDISKFKKQIVNLIKQQIEVDTIM